MTLYFEKGKFEIEIGDIETYYTSTLMGRLPMSVVKLKLTKRYFWFFTKCKAKTEIELDDSYTYPFPKPFGVGRENGVSTYKFMDNPKTYSENFDRYINDLVDRAFQFENPLPQGFNYKSYVREQRLKKILSINEN